MHDCPVHTLTIIEPNMLVIQLHNEKHDKYIQMGLNVFLATITNYLNKDPYDIVSVLDLNNSIVRRRFL